MTHGHSLEQTIEAAAPSLKNSLINFLLLRQDKAGIREIVYQAVEKQAAADANADDAKAGAITQEGVWKPIAAILGIGGVSLVLVALFIPRAEVILHPQSKMQSIVLPVIAGPSVESVFITGSIPAREKRVIVEGVNRVTRHEKVKMNRRGGQEGGIAHKEAPISIYSMTTSSADLAPRGMDFLYSRNRLNVATSRARCVAVVAASPDLLLAIESFENHVHREIGGSGVAQIQREAWEREQAGLAIEAGSAIPEQEAWALTRYGTLLVASGRLEDANAAIEEYLQARGYRDAKVAYTPVEKGGELFRQVEPLRHGALLRIDEPEGPGPLAGRRDERAVSTDRRAVRRVDRADDRQRDALRHQVRRGVGRSGSSVRQPS